MNVKTPHIYKNGNLRETRTNGELAKLTNARLQTASRHPQSNNERTHFIPE